jgi:hypothetical protein
LLVKPRDIALRTLFNSDVLKSRGSTHENLVSFDKIQTLGIEESFTSLLPTKGYNVMLKHLKFEMRIGRLSEVAPQEVISLGKESPRSDDRQASQLSNRTFFTRRDDTIDDKSEDGESERR